MPILASTRWADLTIILTVKANSTSARKSNTFVRLTYVLIQIVHMQVILTQLTLWVELARHKFKRKFNFIPYQCLSNVGPPSVMSAQHKEIISVVIVDHNLVSIVPVVTIDMQGDLYVKTTMTRNQSHLLFSFATYNSMKQQFNETAL